MSWWAWIAAALLGGGASVLRFVVDKRISTALGGSLPAGTFVINITGALLLGLVDGLSLSGTALMVVGTATIGSYTTFSTWMLETQRLREDAELAAAFGNAVLSVTLGFGAVALGRLIGASL